MTHSPRWGALFGLAIMIGACSSPAPSVSPSTSEQSPASLPPSPSPSPSPSPTPSPSPSPTPSIVAGPLPGNLLIADRGNSRLLIVAPDHTVLWSLVLNRQAGWTHGVLAADDAFFTPDASEISINAENQNVIARVDIATGLITWSYGHPGIAGSAAGYLHTPDDAYPLPNGDTLVADIFNERILEISPAGTIVRQLGTTRVQRHDPPRAFAAPNGDTPLADGGILVTEIHGSWVDRIDAAGHLQWSVQLPGIHYPSDAQLLHDGSILVVDYHDPGAVLRLDPTSGAVIWHYLVTSGPGRLDHPSLAVQLSNGNIALNDDNNDRVIVIDPSTNRIVWQYGHTGVPGTGPGYLNGPDGLDPAPPELHLPMP